MNGRRNDELNGFENEVFNDDQRENSSSQHLTVPVPAANVETIQQVSTSSIGLTQNLNSNILANIYVLDEENNLIPLCK